MFAPPSADLMWKPDESHQSLLHGVIDVFRKCSFLRPLEDEAFVQVIDLSHESLIVGWKRLQAWLEDEAYRVKDWLWLVEMERTSRDDDSLLRGGQIRRARALVNRKTFNRFWVEVNSSSSKDPDLFERVLSFLYKSEARERNRSLIKQLSISGLAILLGCGIQR
jgi:hypothetical protein